MKSHTHITLLIGCLAGSVNLATPVIAATSGGTSAAPDPLQMSPFVVQTDQDVGYLAANTLAGSRLNTSLKDTAASISVFTSEFISDIGAFDLSEVVRYAVNVEYQLDDDRAVNPNGNETVGGYQSYRVRGLRASVAQNYFRSSLPTESALVERIEDSRGPNSVLFGIASPGGLINSTTKQAQVGRSFRKGSFTAGSYDSWRGTFDLNQRVLEGKLAFRLNTVFNKTNTFRHWQYQESRRAHLAGKYVFSENTHIRAEFERGQINSNSPRADNLQNSVVTWNDAGRPTFAAQTANATLGIGRHSAALTAPRVTMISNDGFLMAMRGTLMTNPGGRGGNGTLVEPELRDDSINIGGPAQDRFSRFNQFSTFVEHRFSANSFLEVAYNHQDHKFDRNDPQVNAPQLLRGDPNRLHNDGSQNKYVGQLYLEGGWQRSVSDEVSDTGRVMFSTGFDAREWGNYRFAALTEYDKSRTSTSTYREMWTDAVTNLPAFNLQPENTANLVFRRTYPIEGDWATYHIEGPETTGLFKNVYDPITNRTLSTEWFPSSAGSPRNIFTTQKSYMLAGQARYFNGRLILAGGVRRDDLDEYQQGRVRDARGVWTRAPNPDDADPAQPAAWARNTGRNKTLGVVFHVTPWLSTFYNRADNMSLPARGQTRLPDDGTPGTRIPLSPPKGRGEDVGAALDLLEGKIYLRGTYYTTRGEDQSTTAPGAVVDANQRILDALRAAGRITADVHASRMLLGSHGLFDHASEGLELQATANATKQWRFQVNYSHTTAVEENIYLEWRAFHENMKAHLATVDTTGIVTGAGRTPAQELDFALTTDNGLNEYAESDGGLKLGNRHHKANFFTRYNFPAGWLRGAYVGGGYYYQSKLFAGKDPVGEKVWAPSYWRADLLAGYSVKGLPRNRALSFQLNVLNVLDQHDQLIIRYTWETGTQRIFRAVPQSPITWRFTTNFEF